MQTQGALAGNDPDVMLARQQLQQGGDIRPGLRMRLVAKGINPSDLAGEAGGGAGAQPEVGGALPQPAGGSGPHMGSQGGALAPMQQAPEGYRATDPGPGGFQPIYRPASGGAPQAQSPAPALPAEEAGPPAALPGAPEPATQQAPGMVAEEPGAEAGQEAMTPPDPNEIAERVSRAPAEQKREINKAMQSKGIDVAKAFDEWSEKLGKQVEFKTPLSKEDKGLFLLEFGLRMMTASATKGGLEAAGIAGMGTLQSYQEDQGARRKNALAQQELNQKGASQMVGLELQNAQLEQQRAPRGSDVLADDQGFAFFVGPDGAPQFLTDDQGNKVKLDPNMRGRRGGGQPSVFQQKMDSFLSFKSGGDPSKITPEMQMDALAYAGSGMTQAQLRQEAVFRADAARQRFEQGVAIATPPGGSAPKAVFSWTQAEWDRWMDLYVDSLVKRARGEQVSRSGQEILRQAEVPQQRGMLSRGADSVRGLFGRDDDE
jgi:hypothetical protein